MAYNDPISIERTGNGFIVCVRDPEIEAQNRKERAPWRDPQLKFSFETIDSVVEFVKKALSDMSSEDPYTTAFAKAMKESVK
jgi:hypothetical protein